MINNCMQQCLTDEKTVFFWGGPMLKLYLHVLLCVAVDRMMPSNRNVDIL
jgi:hypothetical protein